MRITDIVINNKVKITPYIMIQTSIKVCLRMNKFKQKINNNFKSLIIITRYFPLLKAI